MASAYPIVMFVGQAGSGKDTASDFVVAARGGVKMSLADPLKEMAMKIFPEFDKEDLWGPSDRRNKVYTVPLKPLSVFSRESQVVGLAKSVGAHVSDSEAYHWLWQLGPHDGTFKNIDITPRKVLQTFGTDIVRKKNPDAWIDITIERAHKALLKQGNNVVVIPDGRFRNEVLAVKRVGGKVIRLINSENPVSDSTHPSETEQLHIPDYWFDKVLINVKLDKEEQSLDYFKDAVLSSLK
jgi:hypothetical protein